MEIYFESVTVVFFARWISPSEQKQMFTLFQPIIRNNLEES